MKRSRPGQLAAGAALTAWSLLATSGAFAAGDIANGETLYRSACLGCHDTGIHTRPDKIIFSKKALRNRVEFCEGNTNAGWNASQMDDVTEWLNATFYKYED